FDIGDFQAKEFPDHLLDPLKTDQMSNVLVHGPALQAVEVLVSRLVPVGEKGPVAVQAPMAGGGALDDVPPHPAPCDPEVVGQPYMHLVGVAPNCLAVAEWTAQAPNHDPPVDPKLSRAPPHLAGVYSLERFVGPEEYLLPLVVEVSAQGDVFEFREDEMPWTELATRRGRWDVLGPDHVWRRGVATAPVPFLPL